MAVFGWKKEVKTVVKVIFCAVYMDDSFRWGGRDGNG